MNPASIRYVPRAEIDIQKWDHCIAHARNGLIYGFSFYLDRMAKNWDALVSEDYSLVMPLTWNKKAGICYLYQPALTPMLGVFGKVVDAEVVKSFIDHIPPKFRLIEINLNSSNNLGDLRDRAIQYRSRKNYFLPLTASYQEISSGYNNNIRRNIKRCMSLGCTVQKNVPIDQIVALTKKYVAVHTNVEEEDFNNFQSLYLSLEAQQNAVTYGVMHNGQLVSGAAYFFSHRRAYYILAGNHPNGKTMGTSHYLIDRFIADHAGTDLILDFEGSDISSLAFFYSSFGAELEQYSFIKINRLPWYVKWLK